MLIAATTAHADANRPTADPRTATSEFSCRFRALLEPLLVILCCALLWLLAKPLAQVDNLFGLGNRYDVTVVAERPAAMQSNRPESWFECLAVGAFAPFVPDLSSRARWLHAHAGPALVLVGVAGWVAASLGRWQGPLAVRLSALLALWAVVGYAAAGFTARSDMAPTMTAWSWVGAAAFGVAAAVFALVATRGRRENASLGRREPIAVVAPWVYPGWLLFGGLGCLWLIDYAARGYPKHRFSGVYQFDAWLLCTAVLTFVAAAAPNALATLCRLLARMELGRRSASLRFLGVIVAWLGIVTVAAQHFDPGHRYVATIAEMLRAPVWLGLAWVAYRWVESGLRPAYGLAAGGMLLVVLAGALLLVNDRGPILAQAVAVVIVLGGLTIAGVGRTPLRSLGLAAGVAVAAACLALIGWGLFVFAPPDRLAALDHPHLGRLEFLSEIRWFFHAVPDGGFGLGRVPWCGYAASLGVASCAGVPQQIQSDYVLAALVGVFGKRGAVVLVGLLLFWLGSLVASRVPKTRGRALDLDLFAGWLIVGGATTYAAQTVISSLGTLGAIPLTGVSIPLFAYGGASLLTVAAFCGLAVTRYAPVPTRV